MAYSWRVRAVAVGEPTRVVPLVTLAITGLALVFGLGASVIADTSTAVNNCESEGPPTADVCGSHLTFAASKLTWTLLLGVAIWLAVAILAAGSVTPRSSEALMSDAQRLILLVSTALTGLVLAVAIWVMVT